MKKPLKTLYSLCIILVFYGFNPITAQQKNYPDPGEINKSLNQLQQANPSVTSINSIADSPGGNEVLMMEIGMEVNTENKLNPAILVVGNLEGNRPVTSLAALKLAEDVLSDEGKYENHTWYIVPAGNPDAFYSYFSSPYYENHLNAMHNNDDKDEQMDEDGFNDLNGDGYITQMRVKHPEGEWIVVSDEPRLMRKAKPDKGEQGMYKLYTEGIDDDGDGKYNEDGPGGTNVNVNFPHLFEFFKAGNGLYPGSTPESRAIIEFAFEHPEIAMTFAFGATNFFLSPPKGGRKGEVDLTAIKIPERFANMFGADPDKTYSMKEIIDMVQPMVPAGMTVDESMVASFLGLGAVVNPLEADLRFYNKFKEDYEKYQEEKGIKVDRFDPERAKDGSFELWGYYHLGVPVFSMDIWAVPKAEKMEEEGSGLDIDQLEKMSSEEFLALGEEKIAAFMKESGAPEQFTAERVIKMVESGRTNPAQMAGMMKQMPKPEKDEEGADPKEKALLDYSDEVLNGQGFVDWEKYDHPELGEIEIGGFIPYIDKNPLFSAADTIIDNHIPWIFEVVNELPSLKIYEVKITPQGAGVYKMDIWIENISYIPFPTAMGKRNKQPAPAILSLSGEGHKLLSGKSRTPVNELDGNERKKLTWFLEAERNTEITIGLNSKSAGSDQETIKIGG